MLLGALVDAGVRLEVLQDAVDAVGVEPVRLHTEQVERGGLGALRVHVEVSDTTATRTWADVRAIIEAAPLDDAVRRTALDVFARLAAAEAAVHRVPVDDVHFHEVGALDAIADVVGVAAGLQALGLTSLTASPVSLGSGSTRGAHGPLPVPAPAVLELLRGAPVRAGGAPYEMTTPTGAALLSTVVGTWGELPAMTVSRTGTGAGGRDPAEVANVLRLVVGEPATPTGAALLLETNVDDLDPRVWPAVLQRLLDVGASDAWLTPILMKKGRPAHTLSVLCDERAADAVRRVVFAETSTIGLREQRVGKHALARSETTVDVEGQRVRVKVATHEGRVVNAMPEYDDVAAAAAALGRPVRDVLLAAQAEAQTATKNASTPR
jgi:uncharacterized protein (TIGR00299 family) protein